MNPPNPILANAAPPGAHIVISPTVGRVVWVRCCALLFIADDGGPVNQWDPSQPFRANVDFVVSDRQINVSGADHVGRPFRIVGLTLLQEGDAIPPSGPYAQWMPYQQGQAKKHATEDLAVKVHPGRTVEEVGGQVAVAEAAGLAKEASVRTPPSDVDGLTKAQKAAAGL